GGTTTRAERKKDHWLVNGRKAWITNPHYAKTCIFTAKTNPNPKEGKGITAFIAELDTPGFKVEAKEDKLGMRSSDTAQLVFEDMKLPLDAVAGGDEQIDVGFNKFMKTLAGGRISIAALGLGIAQGAYERARDYARQRKQFGKPIAEFQMIQSKLADMYVWVESMRVFTYQVLRAASLVGDDEGGRGDIHKLTAAGVMYVAETMNKVLNEAVQVHGGTGYIWESEINRLYRSIKLLEIGAGTTEVRKMIISQELLKG
ncbi:MAG TPA: acyl-CoA dehydrogenase, partial [Nevskiaceae bacterium]|nr:acyl-CoA dehydrogenase [Nevskiaceae bacterium]